MTDFKKQGKKNRKKGKDFEKKVREDLEKKGWIVSKWCNNVEFAKMIGTEDHMKKADEYPAIKMMSGKLIPAKPQYNPFYKRIVGEGSGFPDFIIYHKFNPDKQIKFEVPVTLENKEKGFFEEIEVYTIFGVECKVGKYLNKEEKEKCKWLLDNKIFSRIFIARKGKKRGEIIYEKFTTKKI